MQQRRKEKTGAIITWTYNNPPYLASGPKILAEMLRAYEAGAKYIIAFNFPKNPETNLYGILTEEHFTAMRQFWKHTHDYPEDYGKTKGEVVFILPKDYGWGMRSPDDRIWGLWPADKNSLLIWENMNQLLEKYDFKLDIVYDDPKFNFEKYDKNICGMLKSIENCQNFKLFPFLEVHHLCARDFQC